MSLDSSKHTEYKECKWCGQKFPKLAKSHIIPKAFAVPDKQYNRFIITADERKKKRPIGLWDDSILCIGCEQKYSYIDSNAAQILLSDFDKILIPFGNELDVVSAQIDIKYEQSIKTFLIYTLWKASVSSLSELSGISLGYYEDRIKSDIISGRNFNREEYFFIPSLVIDPLASMLPFRTKQKIFDYRDFCHLDFLKFTFDLKIDRGNIPKSFSFLSNSDNIVFLKFNGSPSKKHQAMITIVSKHKEKFGLS